MAANNSVTLIGNLGKDAELRYTQAGKPMSKFPLAVKGFGKDSKPDWFDITWFGNGAEALAQYMTKGKQVAIQGRLQKSSYEKDGKTIWKIDIIAQDVTLLGGGKPADDGEGASEDTGSNSESEDEIPF